jgi:hypothetical protein
MAMKTTRISIEWNYGRTSNIFKYLRNKSKFKLLQSDAASKVYVVCTLLRNFSVCLYGSQSSNYFNLSLPSDFLTAYINQSNVTLSI